MNEEKHKLERIAKRIARAGICSRRDAETLIAEGKVTLNGKILTSPAQNVGPNDKITVRGKPLPEAEKTRLFIYHKPAGLVTTRRDEQGRPTVFDHLPDGLPRVVSVGRLDLNSEGLLLLTNDGELSRHLELPATGWKRKYRVRVHGIIDPDRLAKLKTGIIIEGISYKGIDAEIETRKTTDNSGRNTWLRITLREGKNREIRKVMAHLDLQVTRLIRTDYGPFTLSDLPRGSAKEVPQSVMKEQISKFFLPQKQT
jgi:23S rRNA pseudouridine2605 synthase